MISQKASARLGLLMVLGIILLPYVAMAVDNPVENLTKAGVPGNLTNFTAHSIQWSIETGFYTRWWANFSRPFPDPFGFFYSLYLPVALKLSWGWMAFTMWGAMVTVFYLQTMDTTMPFVIAILAGGVLSYVMNTEQVIILVLAVCFLGAGPLIKFLLGPDR